MAAVTGSQTAADYVVQFGAVRGSSLLQEPDTGDNVAVLLSVEGIGEVGQRGETSPDAEMFGQLGVVCRPLSPSTVSNRSLHAEVLCLRTADGLVPMSHRDLRLRMGGEAPAEGTVALIGYAGGFHSIAPVDNSDMTKGAIHVVYCPYDYAGGVAQKAHCIVLDPTSGNESVSIVHGEGMAIMMSDAGGKNELLLKNKSGNATLRLDDDGITMTAERIVLSGGVVVGDPETAIAFAGGPAMLPCPLFYYSGIP